MLHVTLLFDATCLLNIWFSGTFSVNFLADFENSNTYRKVVLNGIQLDKVAYYFISICHCKIHKIGIIDQYTMVLNNF